MRRRDFLQALVSLPSVVAAPALVCGVDLATGPDVTAVTTWIQDHMREGLRGFVGRENTKELRIEMFGVVTRRVSHIMFNLSIPPRSEDG